MGRKTILIVDNNEDNLQDLVNWICTERFDIQILTASTYVEGKELMKSNHIDIIVLEIKLTDTDDELGLRLAEQYREIYPFNTIIFQTIRDDYKYRADIHDHMGTHVYIPKTELTREKFIDIIKQEIERFKVQFVNKIYIYQRDKKVPIDANAILYLEKVTETKDIKMYIYDREAEEVKVEFLSNLSLEKLLRLPGAANLFRCHKSYIVNKQMIIKSMITDEEGDSFKLRYTDDLVPIGRKFRKEAAQMLQGISV